jgi:hypothetical protein
MSLQARDALRFNLQGTEAASPRCNLLLLPPTHPHVSSTGREREKLERLPFTSSELIKDSVVSQGGCARLVHTREGLTNHDWWKFNGNVLLNHQNLLVSTT